jgi:hypothetical protein
MAKKTLSRAEARRQAATLGLGGFVLVFAAAALFTLPSFQSRSEARDKVETARKEADVQIERRDRYTAAGSELARIIQQVRTADKLIPSWQQGSSVSFDVKLAIDTAVTSAGAQVGKVDDPVLVTVPGLPPELRAYRSVFSFTGSVESLSRVLASIESSGQLMVVSGISVGGDNISDPPLTPTNPVRIEITGVFVFSTKPSATTARPAPSPTTVPGTPSSPTTPEAPESTTTLP